jgi:hypothetical protein
MANEKLDRPERADMHHLAKQTRTIYLSQLGLVLMFVLCALMCLALMTSFKRPQNIAVIDTSSGRSYGTVTQSYTNDLMKMNLIYYSKEFCESYYNSNHTEIEAARRVAVSHMHPTLVQKMGIKDDFFDNAYVKNVKQQLATSTFDWLAPPHVTVTNDPRYTVFCQFRRLTHIGDKNYESKHNVIINWIRYENIDPMKKASPIYVLDFTDGDLNSKEVQQQLELITK